MAEAVPQTRPVHARCFYCSSAGQEGCGRWFYADPEGRFSVVASRFTGLPHLVWKTHEGPIRPSDAGDGYAALNEVCMKVMGSFYTLKAKRVKGHFVVMSHQLKIHNISSLNLHQCTNLSGR